MTVQLFKNPFFPAVAWTVFVTVLSTTSRLPNLPKFELFSADKIAHLVVYAVMVVVIGWAFWRKSGTFRWKNGLFAVLFAASWGWAMEMWQSFLPYRSFELDDEIANCAGAFLGWAVAAFWFRKKAK